MNIKETALKVWDSNMIECPPENLTKFAESLVAELAKENKPVYAFRRKGLDDFCTCDKRRYKELAQKYTLFEVKVLYHSPPTAEQIEQETAEAIAKHFEQSGIGGEYLAEAIRSGAWKEYK